MARDAISIVAPTVNAATAWGAGTTITPANDALTATSDGLTTGRKPITPPPGRARRAGMAELISRWRRMVDDADGAVWSDLEAQDLLDQFRTERTGLVLQPQPRLESGVYVSRLYLVGDGNLETDDSGADAWRLYDNAGAAVSGANVNYLLGEVLFDDDQGGAWRYVDCRSYDLAGAAAQGWRERMASKAGSYDFEADGARYTRSQWFKHCLAMAELYASQRPAGMGVLARSDVQGA